jgi:hypothetical protein
LTNTGTGNGRCSITAGGSPSAGTMSGTVSYSIGSTAAGQTCTFTFSVGAVTGYSAAGPTANALSITT